MKTKKNYHLSLAVGLIFGYLILSGAYNLGKQCFMLDKAEAAQVNSPAGK